jgi:hypothetical protein
VDPDGCETAVSSDGTILFGPPKNPDDASITLGYDGPVIGSAAAPVPFLAQGEVNANYILGNLLAENLKTASSIVSPFTFKNLVKTGGDWDIKNNQHSIFSLPNTVFNFAYEKMENQDVGNFHFGAVGAKQWWASPYLLKRGAGIYQELSGTSKPEWQSSGFPYGDDPRDQYFIRKGLDYGSNH